MSPCIPIGDLDPAAVQRFREMWARKSGRDDLRDLDAAQLLKDAELIYDDAITNAALVLLGTPAALGRLLPQAEVIFEYRSLATSIGSDKRREFRKPAVLYLDEIWSLIDTHNERDHVQSRLVMLDIPALSEGVVREALLNAICHREYRDNRSTFVRQSRRELEIASPGGLPEGITIDNMFFESRPRNRRIAEALSRCGLVERSGQGLDRMLAESLKQGKPRPDYNRCCISPIL